MATDIGLMTVCHCELTCSSLGVHVRSEGSVRSRFWSLSEVTFLIKLYVSSGSCFEFIRGVTSCREFT